MHYVLRVRTCPVLPYLEIDSMMVLDALLIITSSSLCTVSDGSQDGDGMSKAAAASWLELRGAGKRQVRPAP